MTSSVMGLKRELYTVFRDELLSRRDALARDLSQSTAELIDDDSSFSDSVDQAAADTDRGLTVQMKNRGREILVEIDAALRRIEAGVFGECESCGESISEARMKANPATTLCIDCKSESESQDRKYQR